MINTFITMEVIKDSEGELIYPVDVSFDKNRANKSLEEHSLNKNIFCYNHGIECDYKITDAWIIKNSEGLYWQNKTHSWKKNILAASMYSSEKAAKNNYDISFNALNADIKMGTGCFVKKIIIQEE